MTGAPILISFRPARVAGWKVGRGIGATTIPAARDVRGKGREAHVRGVPTCLT